MSDRRSSRVNFAGQALLPGFMPALPRPMVDVPEFTSRRRPARMQRSGSASTASMADTDGPASLADFERMNDPAAAARVLQEARAFMAELPWAEAVREARNAVAARERGGAAEAMDLRPGTVADREQLVRNAGESAGVERKHS